MLGYSGIDAVRVVHVQVCAPGKRCWGNDRLVSETVSPETHGDDRGE